MLASFYPLFLIIHSILRWSILLSGIAVITACIAGLKGRKPFAPLGRLTGLIYVCFLDVQFLVGLLLYAASPIILALWTNPSIGMKNHDLRFFAIEHTTLMFIALAFAHVGAVKSRKASLADTAYRSALAWYSASFVVILLGIPWWRPLLRL